MKDARHVDAVITNNGAYTLAAVANNLVVYKEYLKETINHTHAVYAKFLLV